jgi:hypothetical protein
VIINRNRDAAIAEFEAIVREAHETGPGAAPRHRAGMTETELAAFLESFQAGTRAAS